MCEQYRSKIEDILRESDLSTISTKKIRRELEAQTGGSLDHIKKELNVFIENIFVNFESKPAKQESLVVNDKKTIKKTTAPVIKKKAAPKKKKEPTEKKPINWPLLKVLPPLSDLIHTDLCSRPQTVKKLWEYIREHNLQSETDKRVIICDARLKELCDGQDQVSAFSINKFTQKCFEKIPQEEQAKYKQILLEREQKLTQ